MAPRRDALPTPYLPSEVRSAAVAAQRLAAALAAEGEDLSARERVVLTRALHHNVEVVGQAIAVWLDQAAAEEPGERSDR